MLLPPQSTHPDVWSDVVYVRTLNTTQVQKGRESHVCPLPLDIVERCIERWSMPGELVFDPFAGLFTVPSFAVRMKRRGLGTELNSEY
jgi:DNA modification methylase